MRLSGTDDERTALNLRDAALTNTRERPVNIGVLCSDVHPATATALIELDEDAAAARSVTYGQLAEWSNRFAHVLSGLGVEPGDRVGVVLPQGVETLVAQLGIYKAGAVLVPLTVLFGPDAIRTRLVSARARLAVTDAGHMDIVSDAVSGLPGARTLMVSADTRRPRSFWDVLADASGTAPRVETGPDTPAIMIFTSGTTGEPKGALHGHRVLAGHLPSFEYAYDGYSQQEGQITWTPADWAWIGGMFDAAIPALFHGQTLLASPRRGFDPHWAARLISTHQVTTAFIPPTALRMMALDGARVTSSALRAVITGGESLGAETIDWGQSELGVTINEMYGQTEANFLIGNSSRRWTAKPGSMGRAYPGHELAVVNEEGIACAPGEVGEIVLRLPDPVAMLGYWDNDKATAAKVRAGWLHTGDWAVRDEEGYFRFFSRKDDIINSSGYRIGPSEIEKCLETHPKVREAAVVGVPDPLRGQAVKAFVVAEGTANIALADELRTYIRQRLGNYQYPRVVEFVSAIPTTTTGKRMRRALQ
jgi:acetyl-CoA synthetase